MNRSKPISSGASGKLDMDNPSPTPTPVKQTTN
jgi:hypothetical protein